jgi:hypothetical protein
LCSAKVGAGEEWDEDEFVRRFVGMVDVGLGTRIYEKSR